ncbi:MAG: sulfatase [Lachnospiraceae bacterium]|jgi:choline-sulfatase|nr:sulfatase [Lachnospiraceae bacterium]
MRVLYVDIDTLRPDHMGCYGYSRNTTPNFDEVAKEGVRFDEYYCSDAPCLPSRAALISGMFGIHNGAVGHGGTAGDKRYVGAPRDFRDRNDSNNFNNIFRKAGMHTVSISSFPERHSSWWYNAGFNEMYNVGKGGMESGEEVLPIALDWLERNQDRDSWYMHVHLWDPHTPYRAPAELGNPFKDEPQLPWLTDEVLEEHKQMTGPHGAQEIGMYTDAPNPRYPRHPGRVDTPEQLKDFIDQYDCGVYWADHLIGQIFDKLKQQGIYEDTAIIISSDHGENLGELGLYAEHATADYPTCHIPMIIKWPGCQKGIVDEAFHYQIDLVPTVADLLEVPHYEKWDGSSYAPTLQTGETCGQDHLIISQCAHVCQRSARFDDWVYVRTIHDGYHLFDREMLFNVKDDPHEQHDVKAEHPDVCARGAKMILDWQEAQMLSSDSEVDPLWTVMREGGPLHARGHLKEYLERLEATGRAEGARILRERHPNEI